MSLGTGGRSGHEKGVRKVEEEDSDGCLFPQGCLLYVEGQGQGETWSPGLVFDWQRLRMWAGPAQSEGEGHTLALGPIWASRP